MEKTILALGLFTLVLSALLNTTMTAVLTKWLIKTFRPDFERNTWGRAFSYGAIATAVGVGAQLFAAEQDTAWIGLIVLGGGLLIPTVLLKELYNLGALLSFALYLLIGIFSLAIVMGSVIGLGFLVAIHPVVAMIVIGGLGLGFFAHVARARRQASVMRAAMAD